MNIAISNFDSNRYEGNVVFLYGDEVSRRLLPFKKDELTLIEERRADDKEAILRFDRLPGHIYVVCCDVDQNTERLHERLRRSAAKVRKMLVADKAKDCLVTGQGIITEDALAFVEGLVLADYSFDRYFNKTREHVESLFIDNVLVEEKDVDSFRRLMNRIYWCREWVNTPVADLNAPEFADELESIAKDLGVKCTVLNKKQIESLRMGGLTAVNKGSVDEPRFVVLEYKPKKPVNKKPLALVGKGIMYDTGGLNIKPDDYMQEMKSDMAGAATMASVVFAAAESGLPVWTVACLPLTDNRPGFNAYAADDILTMYNGTTVEVVNTDAEGRLILADAIAYAVKNYNPRVIIDAATLTGAAVRAISTFGIAAMEQNGRKEIEMLKLVGEQVYERLVEFPMWKEYDELIKSDYADLRNSGNTPQAGTITAGKFLAHFAKEVPYVHLDIAGVAYFTKAQHCWRPGASGYGVRLLYAYLQMQ